MGEVRQVFAIGMNALAGWVMTGFAKQVFAISVSALAALAGWAMIGFIIAQIGSDSPGLALYHNIFRVGAAAVLGIAGYALAGGRHSIL